MCYWKGAVCRQESKDIITFENATPQPKDYEQKHWNAVILCNYIHGAINGKPYKSKDEYIEKTKDVFGVLNNGKLYKLSTHYGKYGKLGLSIKDDLLKAVRDIQKYVNALKLNEYLYKFRTSKQNYETNC